MGKYVYGSSNGPDAPFPFKWWIFDNEQSANSSLVRGVIRRATQGRNDLSIIIRRGIPGSRKQCWN